MAKENTWAGISEFQVYLFNTGENYQSYKMLGARPAEVEGQKGWRFAVWAPNAQRVRVVGDFNGWDGEDKPLEKIGTTGVWYGFFTDLSEGTVYKYAIDGCDGQTYYKADPYALCSELRPNTASIAKSIDGYAWQDRAWLSRRERTNNLNRPVNIYEVHLGSWRIHEDGSFYTYRELAQALVPYVKKMGYTHIELMPIMEYPFDGSWGYQVTGYFCVTPRYGSAEDFKYFVDQCHQNGIGVIMDWVPAHFPRDAHGLRRFDGSPVYEYADPRMGEHKDWGTMVFDYSKNEVVSFLLSSAYFWAEEYHIDGLRVDAVSSMLYRDYSRNDGEWIPNKFGGNGNLEAVELFKSLNRMMGKEFPNFMMIAEESTSWPLVTAPPEHDGLGFHFKWNMGWMNDTLRYMAMDPYFRKDNHGLMTFLMMYAYSENFILPLSHDEVVHGKKSLIDKMYGDYEQKFSAYKTLLGYYMSMPGKKLLFMGGEIGQFLEWKYDDQLEWQLLEQEKHQKLQDYVRDLNRFYLENKSFWEIEQSWDGFRWINDCDQENSVFSYLRQGRTKSDYVIVVANFTFVDRPVYKIGVSSAGSYEVVFHSNATRYGGNKRITKKTYKAVKEQYSDMPYTLKVSVDGGSIMYLKKKKTQPAQKKEIPKKVQKKEQTKKI